MHPVLLLGRHGRSLWNHLGDGGLCLSGDARPLSGGDDNPRGRDDIPWGGDGIPDGIDNVGLGDGGGGFRCDSRRGNGGGGSGSWLGSSAGSSGTSATGSWIGSMVSFGLFFEPAGRPLPLLAGSAASGCTSSGSISYIQENHLFIRRRVTSPRIAGALAPAPSIA